MLSVVPRAGDDDIFIQYIPRPSSQPPVCCPSVLSRTNLARSDSKIPIPTTHLHPADCGHRLGLHLQVAAVPELPRRTDENGSAHHRQQARRRKQARFGSSPFENHPPKIALGAAVQPQARRWVTSKTPLPAPPPPAMQQQSPPVHPFQNQTLKPPPVKIDRLRRPLPYITGDYLPVDPNCVRRAMELSPPLPGRVLEWDEKSWCHDPASSSTALRVTSTQLHHLRLLVERQRAREARLKWSIFTIEES